MQAARDEKEQNMEAYVKNNSLYFRTIKRIEANDELLVWFSEEYAKQLNIPKIEEGSRLECERCKSKFEYPYSYRSHVKFKCQAKNKNVVPPASPSPPSDAVTPKPPLAPSNATPILPATLPMQTPLGVENTQILHAVSGMLKTNNPMVEKILSCASLPPAPAPSAAVSMQTPLNQNWCAKCNATFRMTSDLVYHMRTHHKRETRSPVSSASAQRIRRDEKLHCSICGEGFRERHHLTRHMTSHI